MPSYCEVESLEARVDAGVLVTLLMDRPDIYICLSGDLTRRFHETLWIDSSGVHSTRYHRHRCIVDIVISRAFTCKKCRHNYAQVCKRGPSQAVGREGFYVGVGPG